MNIYSYQNHLKNWISIGVIVLISSCAEKRIVIKTPSVTDTEAKFLKVHVPSQLYRKKTETHGPAIINLEEIWKLRHKNKNTVVGQIERHFHVKTDLGTNFSCNHGNSYDFIQIGKLNGRLVNDGIKFERTLFQSEPSKCAPKESVKNESFHLLYRDSHFIARTNTESYRLKPLDKRKILLKSISQPQILAEWAWKNNSSHRNIRREEHESWTLNKKHVFGESILFSGHMTRHVKVTNTANKNFKCSKKNNYEINDNYKIQGRIENQIVTIVETIDTIDANPCVEAMRRTDTAKGILKTNTLELTWRGAYKQTLTRQHPQ